MAQIKSVSDFLRMYVDGFKNMTWGRPLWVIIAIKLFIMFAILKVFFFPNFLNQQAASESEKSEYVANELTRPSQQH